MRRLLPLSVLLLGGCAWFPQKVVVQMVDKPVPVSCISKRFPAKPTYPDTKDALLAQPSFDGRYQLMAEGWWPRDARLALLESAVANCQAVAPPPPEVAAP